MAENIRLPAKIENLERIIQFVRRCARDEGFSRKKISNIELAMEEAFANICYYAYKESDGEIEVECSTDKDRRFIVDIVDAGRPFNILTVSKPDLSAGVSDREIGGLGVLLIRSMVDDIQYCRKDDKNVLTLILIS